MSHFRHSGLVGLCVIAATGIFCAANGYAELQAEQPVLVKDPTWIQSIQQSLESRFSAKASPQKTFRDRDVALFYQNKKFNPVWVTRSGFSVSTEAALEVFQNAHQEGLDPKDYMDAAEKVDAAKQDASKLLEAEIALTRTALEYIDDLGGERLNPRKISKKLYLKPDPVDAVAVLTQGTSIDQTGDWLRQLTVEHEEYQNLKKLLAHYRSVQGDKEMPLLPSGPMLKKGDKGKRVGILQKQLQLREVLAHAVSKHFDEDTESAVRAFQAQNGLKVDGVVGSQTRSVLNLTAEQRVKQIIVTMERWRWLSPKLGDRYIFVNIAGFYLKGVENGQTVLEMPVIIGRNYRQTPVFSSYVNQVRFNPSWYVPRGIAVKDKLEKIKKDPGYLTRGDYVLYSSDGSAISPHSVNWTNVSANNFPYRLRQRPGSQNALGKVRFNIVNPFNVYLHSTPDKHLFDKSVRNFSSGCVRVGKPAELAQFILNQPSKWSLQTISANMQGTGTRNVSVNRVPTHITYLTVFTDDTGNTRFVPDVYGQDKLIYNALKNRRRG